MNEDRSFHYTDIYHHQHTCTEKVVYNHDVHTSLVIFLFIDSDQDSSTDKEKKCNKQADAANGHITASSENGIRLQRK